MADDEKGRFKKGWSGGPGRPKKGETFSDLLEKHLSPDEMAQRLAHHVRCADLTALKYAIDRVYGKPIETVRQTIKEIPEFVRFDDADDPEDQETNPEPEEV